MNAVTPFTNINKCPAHDAQHLAFFVQHFAPTMICLKAPNSELFVISMGFTHYHVGTMFAIYIENGIEIR
jgi:hypothetical protein